MKKRNVNVDLNNINGESYFQTDEASIHEAKVGLTNEKSSNQKSEINIGIPPGRDIAVTLYDNSPIAEIDRK